MRESRIVSEVSIELSAGDRFNLAVALRESIVTKIAAEDREALVRLFEIDSREDESWTETFIRADPAHLIALAGFFSLSLPENLSTPPRTEDLKPVDAYSELVAAETALRDVIRLAIPNWKSELGEDEIGKLEMKLVEEDKKRDGITVSQDLLDYTEVYLLRKLINSHWESIKPIFDDKKRTEVYLDIIFDVRNTIGHSRPVVPSERFLLAGAAGQIRNQLARYRSSQDGSAMHYSSIDSARDSFGTDGGGGIDFRPVQSNGGTPRLEVGDKVTFTLEATDPRGRDTEWAGYLVPGTRGPGAYSLYAPPRFSGSGSQFVVEWTVSERDVGEGVTVVVILKNASGYQRRDGIDDARQFIYHVNPPL